MKTPQIAVRQQFEIYFDGGTQVRQHRATAPLIFDRAEPWL
jgi:hypothetical protein